MLRDAAHEHGADLELLPDLAGILLVALEAEHGAARHDLQVGHFRERADQAFGEAVAQVLVAGIGRGVYEGQDGDATTPCRLRPCRAGSRSRQRRSATPRPRFLPRAICATRPRLWLRAQRQSSMTLRLLPKMRRPRSARNRYPASDARGRCGGRQPSGSADCDLSRAPCSRCARGRRAGPD